MIPCLIVLAAFGLGVYVGYQWSVWACARAVVNGSMRRIVEMYEERSNADI